MAGAAAGGVRDGRDVERTVAQLLARRGAQLLRPDRVQAGDRLPHRPDAPQERLPPLLEARVGNGDGEDVLGDIAEPRTPSQVAEVALTGAANREWLVTTTARDAVHGDRAGVAVAARRSAAGAHHLQRRPLCPRLGEHLPERLGRLEPRAYAAAQAVASAVRDLGEREAAFDRLELVRASLEGGGPVTVAYAAGTQPSVPDAVAAARTAGAPTVAVASYLLAEGFFHDRLSDAGADVVTPPLGDADAVLAVVLSRW